MGTGTPATSTGGIDGSIANGSLAIHALRKAYRKGALNPVAVVGAIYDRIEARGDDGVWVTLVSREDALAAAAEVDVASQPLAGVPTSANMQIVGCVASFFSACIGPREFTRRLGAKVVERHTSQLSARDILEYPPIRECSINWR